MDIDAIPAGRELDALIAEKVMGYKLMQWINRPECPPVIIDKGQGLFADNENIPQYSIDWADSLKVLAEMRCRSFLWRLEDCGDSFEAEFIIGMEPFYFTSNANTAPLAICRAALKAIGA